MEFSIDMSMDTVHNKETKKVFKEVISSYNNENYRSAIVMLYTVVICDLIYKMQDLKDMYQDKKAEDILSCITKKQEDENNSPRWEEELITMIRAGTELLSDIEVKEIRQLKYYRNLSAHPVLKSNNILYVPTREQTSAHIRAMVEAVLSKPPLLSRKITDSFLDDLSLHKDDFVIRKAMIDTNLLGVFLENRYFRFMGNSLKKYLFKDLWKIVFIKTNNDCDKNRIVNFYALECLYEDAKEIIKSYIKDNLAFFSVKKEFMLLMYEFLLKYNEIYPLLSEDVKLEIEAEYKKDNEEEKILAVFLKENLKKHCDDILEYFENRHIRSENIQKSLRLLYEYSCDKCKSVDVLKCYIKIFSQSLSYEDAKDKLNIFIFPYLEYIKGDELTLLIDSIKQNGQIKECYYVQNNLSVIDNHAKMCFGDNYSLKDEIYGKSCNFGKDN